MHRIERVLLVRHGQTDWNVEGRWQGSEPVALNKEGWAQARLLANYLRGRPISRIYSSDLPRALETASVIGQAVNVTPQVDVRLQEFNLGIFQGLTREEMQMQFKDEWKAFHEDFWDYAVPGGETRRAFQDRLYAAWQDAIAQSPGPEVVIVSHGGAIKQLLLRLFEDDPAVQNLRFENTSVTTLEPNDSNWKLTEAGAVPHL
jgi:broad specificity phosphatase PhoE